MIMGKIIKIYKILCNMIKILEKSKYDKMQYDKLFSFFYHIQCSKYGNKNNQWVHLQGI